MLACQAARCACSNGDHMFGESCDVVDVLFKGSDTESLKPVGMTRGCRSSFCTHPRSTHPDRHTPLHVKTLDFTWFTATCTRSSSRSPLVRTACVETRGDLCTAGEGTVGVDVCPFRSSSFSISQCQKLRCVFDLSTPAAILDHSPLIAIDIFSKGRAPKLTFGLFVCGSSPPPPLYPRNS